MPVECNAEATGIPNENTAKFTLDDPGSSENHLFFFTDVQLTVTKLAAVVDGTSSPSVTYTITHDTDASASGTQIVTGGVVVTSETDGEITTVFNAAVIPANSWVRFKTTAQSGTVDQINVTVIFR